MTVLNLYFYLNGFLALGATLLALTARNAIHGLLYFILSILALAVSFYLFDAPLISALEVMVYAGAIMVLFIFVVMLLNIPSLGKTRSLKVFIGPFILALLLLSEMVFMISISDFSAAKTSNLAVQQIAFSLFSDYALGIEVASLILTAGLVGAFHVGRKRRISC